MRDRRYALIYSALGLTFVAVVALAIAFSSTGRSGSLPGPLESIEPEPNATALRQATIVVDMDVGYRLDITVDGVPIPSNEVAFVESLGRYEWGPSPGKMFERWTPGEHEVRITWDTLFGLPDQGSYSWSFRIQ